MRVTPTRSAAPLALTAMVLGLATLLPGAAARAQASLTEQTLTVLPSETDVEEFGFRTGSIVAAPVPFSNPTIGNGLALGAAWLFDSDAGSGTSSIGLGGFRSDNGSFGYGLGLDLNFVDNRYQVSFLAAHADVVYDYTAGGSDLELGQVGDLYRLDLLYGFTEDIAAGIGVRYLETKLRPRLSFGEVLPIEVEAALNVEILKYGILGQWDGRNDDIFPTNGTRLTYDAFHAELLSRGDRTYQKSVLAYDIFRPGFRDGDAIGGKLTLCAATDEAPFFDACGIGMSDGFRGFSVTDFIDDRLISVQTEYRGRIGSGRFGYGVFSGVGIVGEEFATFHEAEVHAAAGAGLRYRVSREFPVDFRVDTTFNDEGESFYYISVGQAF